MKVKQRTKCLSRSLFCRVINQLSSVPLVSIIILISFVINLIRGQSDYAECVRYEFHDPSLNNSQVDAIRSNCRSKFGVIEKESVRNITTRPLLINTTFECCSKYLLIT